MAEQTYRVLFTGQIREGSNRDEVKARLARLFGKSATEIESLFSGKPRVLKKVQPLEEGRKLVAASGKAGAVASLETVNRA